MILRFRPLWGNRRAIFRLPRSLARIWWVCGPLQIAGKSPPQGAQPAICRAPPIPDPGTSPGESENNPPPFHCGVNPSNTIIAKAPPPTDLESRELTKIVNQCKIQLAWSKKWINVTLECVYIHDAYSQLQNILFKIKTWQNETSVTCFASFLE